MVQLTTSVLVGAMALNSLSVTGTPIKITETESNPLGNALEEFLAHSKRSEVEQGLSDIPKLHRGPVLELHQVSAPQSSSNIPASIAPGINLPSPPAVSLAARGVGSAIATASPFVGLIPSIIQIAQNLRHHDSAPAQSPSAAPAPQRRELEELLGRELSDVEIRGFGSLAGPLLGLLPGIASIFSHHDSAPAPKRRELEELFGRELSDVEVRGFGKAIGSVAPLVGLLPSLAGLLHHDGPAPAPQSTSTTPAPQRRELEELWGRELSDVEVRGIGSIFGPLLGGLLPSLAGVFHHNDPAPAAPKRREPLDQKRDLEVLLGRELTENEARGLGASFGKGLFKELFHLGGDAFASNLN
ncbi:hypothetical protein HGRIS_011387 [Hohenbuehelia grisea]|uniref:DUF937 domain-containing protein n=1 Tax=Hohenbuehelia grisea TaxID=104357 RepID=A0ABR3JVW3_9AGAR